MKGGHYAVIGAGASGTLQALHLLRAGAGRVTMIEREREPGRGTAYGTRRPEHLLNVTAARMIVYPDDPDRFARWVEARGGAAGDYAPRMMFGDYLCEELAAAGPRIERVAGQAVDVVRRGAGEAVLLADGREVAADAVVLALGNLRPATPPGIDPEALGAAYVADPWYGGITDGLGGDDLVLLIGTGLTAIDAALTLDAEGFGGRILAMSRRGLAPRSNLPDDAAGEWEGGFPADCAELLRSVRRRSAEIGWRETVLALRPVTQDLWSAAGRDERSRFLRHLRPWWDVHRHRIAPAVADRIGAMERDGRLAFAAGKLAAVEAAGEGAVVSWRPRGQDAPRRLHVRRIVNCTGPELDVARAGDPLLSALLATGRIRPDGLRIGVDVDRECRAIGREGAASPSLSAIGPITRGAFWESVAVPDIAVQAQAIARRLIASLWLRA